MKFEILFSVMCLSMAGSASGFLTEDQRNLKHEDDNDCKVCKNALDIHAAGSKEIVDVDITYDCDVNMDAYKDLMVCLKIRESDLSEHKSEDLIGAAFDLFEGMQFPDGVKISDVTIVGPDQVGLQDVHKWLKKDQVCSEDRCEVKPTFKVSGGNVPDPFDGAVKFNSGSDDAKVHEACFLINADCYDMPIWALQDANMYARIVAANDRDDLISKMVGEMLTCEDRVDPKTAMVQIDNSNPKCCKGHHCHTKPPTKPPTRKPPCEFNKKACSGGVSSLKMTYQGPDNSFLSTADGDFSFVSCKHCFPNGICDIKTQTWPSIQVDYGDDVCIMAVDKMGRPSPNEKMSGNADMTFEGSGRKRTVSLHLSCSQPLWAPYGFLINGSGYSKDNTVNLLDGSDYSKEVLLKYVDGTSAKNPGSIWSTCPDGDSKKTTKDSKKWSKKNGGSKDSKKDSKKSTKGWGWKNGGSSDSKDGSGKNWGWKNGGGGSRDSKDGKDVTGKKNWGWKEGGGSSKSKDGRKKGGKKWGKKDSKDGSKKDSKKWSKKDSKDSKKSGKKDSKKWGHKKPTPCPTKPKCVPKTCKRKLDERAAGTNEIIHVDIEHGCGDIKVCLKIDEASISEARSEDLIGVAFDMFKAEGEIPPFLHIHEVVITGPEVIKRPSSPEDPNWWVDKGQVCSNADKCRTVTPFKVSGGNVPEPFDAAVKFNSDSDEITCHSACFKISIKGSNMHISALNGVPMYARIQTTDNADSPTDTSKMMGTIIDC